MSDVRYTEDHEYVKIEGNTATIGITDYAQQQLGDVVFVELPEAGTNLEKGQETATVESVKAASEIFAPISGEVVEANEGLTDEPALVNSDPEGEAWFWKMSIADASELESLMDAAAYQNYVAGLD